MLLTNDLCENTKIFKTDFKDNAMIVYRELENVNEKKVKATLIFADGLAGSTLVGECLIRPFLSKKISKDENNVLDFVHKSILYSNDVRKSNDVEDCVISIFSGDAVMLIENCSYALVINVRSPFYRSVSEPQNEKTLKGSREGFGELILQNTSMLMRKLKNKNLKLERFIFGKDTQTTVLLCYVENICQKSMIEKVRQSLKKIQTDSITDTNQIAEIIKGHTYSPFKTSGSTERPDVVANKLLEGRLAIMIDGSPQVITIPFLFSEYFQVSDDYTINFYFASISRIIRYIAFLISIYLPAVYICAVMHQKTMIPQKLLLSLSQERANVPFSVSVEVFVFLIFFEVIREAATRTPSAIGQTLSIVGGIILSQTAISANLISTPSIIVIAIAGVSSVILPTMIGATTMLRIIFVFLATLGGLQGLVVGSIILIVHLCSIDILDIAYINSTLPVNKYSFLDTIIRAPFSYLKNKKDYMKRKF